MTCASASNCWIVLTHPLGLFAVCHNTQRTPTCSPSFPSLINAFGSNPKTRPSGKGLWAGRLAYRRHSPQQTSIVCAIMATTPDKLAGTQSSSSALGSHEYQQLNVRALYPGSSQTTAGGVCQRASAIARKLAWHCICLLLDLANAQLLISSYLTRIFLTPSLSLSSPPPPALPRPGCCSLDHALWDKVIEPIPLLRLTVLRSCPRFLLRRRPIPIPRRPLQEDVQHGNDRPRG